MPKSAKFHDQLKANGKDLTYVKDLIVKHQSVAKVEHILKMEGYDVPQSTLYYYVKAQTAQLWVPLDDLHKTLEGKPSWSTLLAVLSERIKSKPSLQI